MKKEVRVVIVGASSGMGRALAEALASRGVLVGAAARSTEALRELKQKYPKTVHYATIDVTSPEAVRNLNELIDRLGGMDIFVQASGVGGTGAADDLQKDMDVARTNALGFMHMTGAAFDWFRRAGRPGQIVGITSVSGVKGMAAMGAYTASKRFDWTWLTALDQKAHALGLPIAITDIRPGWVRTPLVDPDKKYMMEMTVDEVLPQILRAIVRRKRIAWVDWRWGLLINLTALIPDRIWARFPYRP